LQITYNGIGETRTYNSLLQLTSIYTGSVSLTYNYTAGQDNGKIASTTNNVSGEQVVYTYDSPNRLIQAQTASNPSVTQWGQGFVYDGFGNLLQKNVTRGSAPSMTYTVNAATNQLQGLGYDANGNMTNPPQFGFTGYLSGYAGGPTGPGTIPPVVNQFFGIPEHAYCLPMGFLNP
jgi:hypothetical protein